MSRTLALSGEGAEAGPQVMIGLTASRNDEASSSLEAREARDHESHPRQKLEVMAEPTLELVHERERLELVREESLEIVREAVESVRETLAIEAEETEPQDVGPLPAAAYFAADDDGPLSADPFPSAPIALTARASGVVAAAAPTEETTDEMSIPPVGDLSVEPVAEQFFSEGEIVAAKHAGDVDDWDDTVHKAVQKSAPHVVQRRARFARYVRWAVGSATIVCVAALARTVLVPGAAVVNSAPMPALGMASRIEAPAVLAVEAQPEAKAARPEAKAEPVADRATPAASVAPAESATPAGVTPVAEAATVEAPKVDVPKATETADGVAAAPVAKTVVTGDKTAREEKNDARRALERGKLVESIEAGERAVALDATDGEAWLLLGAAYQEKGNLAEARRCYSACLKEGKRGPLGECRAMLR